MALNFNGVHLVAILSIVLSGCGTSNDSTQAAKSEHISVVVTETGQTAVGQPEEVHFTLRNIGSSPIQSLVMINLLSEFKKYNVMLSNSCIEDQHSAEGDVLSCGKLAAGDTISIDIGGVAKEVGNFSMTATFRDDTGNFDLLESDGKPHEYNVDEAVLPG